MFSSHHYQQFQKPHHPHLNPHSSLCVSPHGRVSRANAIGDSAPHYSPDCVISDNSFLLLPMPRALQVYWRSVRWLILVVSAVGCKGHAQVLLRRLCVWLVSYNYTRGQYYCILLETCHARTQNKCSILCAVFSEY